MQQRHVRARGFAPRRGRGFTLIELMIVVAIIGILAVLALYGVTSTGVGHFICGSALATVVADWRGNAVGEDAVGWHCCTTGAIANDDVLATANGDLDGNGIQSTFALEGKVTAGQSQLIWAPKPLETLPEE